MSRLSELFPPLVLDHRQSIAENIPHAAKELGSVVLCYYASAVLVQIPQTFAIRLALLPLTILACVRATLLVDWSEGRLDKQYANQCVTFFLFMISCRAVVWTFARKPYRRLSKVYVEKPVGKKTDELKTKGNKLPPKTTSELLNDAADLMFNLRGLGWNWSLGLRVPKDTRNTSSAWSYYTTTAFYSFSATLLMDLCLYHIKSFGPTTFGSPTGGAIFDPAFPPLIRYARAYYITLIFGLVSYFCIDALYYLLNFIGVLIFRQEPGQWPANSNQPWKATSLNEFWTLRWHQMYREIFIGVGGWPLAMLTGKYGGILGAYLVSGALHDFGCWAMGRGTDPLRVSGFFVMNGVGCIIEMLIKSATGHRVGGWFGRLWGLAWLVFWGAQLVDAWSLRGFTGGAFFPDGLRVSEVLFGPLKTVHNTPA